MSKPSPHIRKAAIIVMIFGVLLATGMYFYYSPFQRIKRHGYSDAEARIMLGHLTRDELPSVLRYEYISSLISILQDPSYNPECLNNYILLGTTTDFSPAQIVALGNHTDFDVKETYTTAKYDTLMQPYYLSSRRERYFEQLQANTDGTLVAATIVKLVNSNRDRDYYADPEPAKDFQPKQMLVNKYYYLAADYQPELTNLDTKYGSSGVMLDPEAYLHFQSLFEAALEAGYQLYVTSAYRDYVDQEMVFNDYLSTIGEAGALEYAAKPGFSEHQTGLALDIFVPGETTTSFQYHPAAAWLAEHAYEYGFILRYPQGEEDITGYNYEAWHYRYVGTEAARTIQEHNLTYEEYWAYYVAG